MDLLREAGSHRDNVHIKGSFDLCDLRTAFGKACMDEADCDLLDRLIKEFKTHKDIPAQYLYSRANSWRGCRGCPQCPLSCHGQC